MPAMYERTVLDNGLRIITSTMPHSRSVGLAVLVGAGSCYEQEPEAGVSHFAEHLFFKGTRRRPTAREISQDIEGVGGMINASTDKEVTVFWCKTGSDHFDIAADVLSDLLLDSLFDGEEMEKERQVVIEEINMNRDLPQQRVGVVMDELLWPGQPLGWEVAGTRETVSKMRRGDVVRYVSGRYGANNAVVSIAGGIGHEQAVAQVKRLLGGWSAVEAKGGYVSDDRQRKPSLRTEYKEGEQAHICLGVRGLSRFHPQRYVLGLLNVVLGGGMSSRLFTEIREKRGLAYDIHSYAEYFLHSGSFVTYAGVDPEKLEVAIEAILAELSKLKREVSPDELARAREMSKGRLQLRLEDSQQMALWLGSQELLMGRILDIDEVLSIIDAITVDELGQVAGKLLSSRRLNLAVVGPVKDGPTAEILRL